MTATESQSTFPSYPPEIFTQREFQDHKAKLHQLNKYYQSIATTNTEKGFHCYGLHSRIKNVHKTDQPAEREIEQEALPT